jgi:glucan biosynthesis protein C
MMNTRLYYLDALRGFAMVFGIFLHANTLFEPYLFPIVSDVSRVFRMPMFFAVSGFFVALVTDRTSYGAMLGKRSVSLLVPFFSALILLNPITNYLIHIYHNPWMSLAEYFSGGWRLPAQGPGVWLLHLWFLVSLWVYVVISPVLRFLFGTAPARRLLEIMAGWRADVLIVTAALFVAGAVTGLRVVYVVTLDPFVEGTRYAWILRATLQNLPYFALGLVLYASPALFERFHRVSWPALALGLGMVLLAGRYGAGLPPALETVISIFARVTLTVANIAALLWIFRVLFPRANAGVAALVGSIYTVYLFHFLVIYIWGLLLRGVISSDPALYFVVVVLTFATTFALHHWVIERVPVLRLMFNGRMPARAAPVARQV